jgi:hypothetical protein
MANSAFRGTAGVQPDGAYYQRLVRKCEASRRISLGSARVGALFLVGATVAAWALNRYLNVPWWISGSVLAVGGLAWGCEVINVVYLGRVLRRGGPDLVRAMTESDGERTGSRENPSHCIRDAALGRLHSSEGSWFGRAEHRGAPIDLIIDGNAAGPDSAALELIRSALRDLDRHVATAAAHVAAQLENDRRNLSVDFAPTGLAAGAEYQQGRSSFTLYTELDGDPEGAWRFEIGPEGVINYGRDS